MTKRIEYIDAMRGFAMLLVVFAHVETFSIFNFAHETIVGHLLACIMMPLFFFTSGFVMFREGKIWSASVFLKEGAKRIRILLLPALFFGIIYTVFVKGTTMRDFLLEPAKNGYWFTIALLEIVLIYNAVETIIFRYKKRTDLKLLSMSLVALSILLFACKLPIKIVVPLRQVGDISCLHYTCLYFQFFSFGILVSAWKKYSDRIFSCGAVYSVALAVFLVCFYLRFFFIEKHIPLGMTYTIIDTLFEVILGYCGVIITFVFFRKFRNISVANEKKCKVLQCVGRRTLDIYMIHYFLLPTIPLLGTILIETPNSVIELLCAGGLALAVTLICLVISSIIRLSDFFSYWLLGAKYPSEP